MKQNEPQPVEVIGAPLKVSCVDDEIVFIGPGSVAFSMTIDAARATSLRLVRALADCSVG